MSDPSRQFLRHTLATLAYRAGKALRGAPDSFADFSGGTRPPGKVLAHMADLVDWGLNMSKGVKKWTDSDPLPWQQGVERFFAAVQTWDAYLASDAALAEPCEKLFQGPIADALNHTGQIAMLRRMAGCPIKGENYFVSEIEAGRVGLAQAAPKREFD